MHLNHPPNNLTLVYHLIGPLILLITGCATGTGITTQEIPQDTILSILADPTRTLPLEVGDTISISTSKEIGVYTEKVTYLKLVIKVIDDYRIVGKVYNEEDVEPVWVAVNLDIITHIRVWREESADINDVVENVVFILYFAAFLAMFAFYGLL